MDILVRLSMFERSVQHDRSIQPHVIEGSPLYASYIIYQLDELLIPRIIHCVAIDVTRPTLTMD